MTPAPELIAHRGASRERPENTLAAFERAAELGADAIELDVHLTADGHLIVHHDPAVRHGPDQHPIRTLTLSDVRSLRVSGEPIPTLAEVVAAVGGRLRVYCELKGPGTAEAACTTLASLGERAAVHSFDHRLVAAARGIAPAMARGILETSYHVEPCHAMQTAGARDLWQHESLIDAALVREVHRCGGRVIAWTVNAAGRATGLAAHGVDGICTDDVAAVRSALREGAASR